MNAQAKKNDLIKVADSEMKRKRSNGTLVKVVKYMISEELIEDMTLK